MDSQTSDNTLQGGDELEFIELVGSYLDGQLTPDELARLNEQLRNDDARRETFVRYCLQGKLLAEALLAGIPLPTDELPTKTPSPLAPPALGSLGAAMHGIVSYFSSGWPVAYLVAAVILGLGLLIGAFVHVSTPIQVARQAPPLPSSSSFVGRITGMVDCQWETEGLGIRDWGLEGQRSKVQGSKRIQSLIPNPQSLVSLGDTFALSSGLMEITYDTGAKVILQGPAMYEVESATGGYLSVGKLTARVEKKVDSGEWIVDSAKRQASNPQSLIPNPSLSTTHYPLFTIKTPIATVTDLGTEFGVEVSTEGNTTSHVFRGSVELQTASANGKSQSITRVLHENESACVESVGGQGGGSRLTVLAPSAKLVEFVRTLPQATIKTLDLVDVVAGGDGFSGRRNQGIDATNGRPLDVMPATPRDAAQWPIGDHRYHRVDGLPLVDGVFIPDGSAGPVQTSSAGHEFAGFPHTSNRMVGCVWAGGALPTEMPYKLSVLGRVDYASASHGLVFLHANKAVTFDLEAIRRANPGWRPLRFQATAGNTEQSSASGNPADAVSADAWVLVDGQSRFYRRQINGCSGAFPVVILLSENDRFLTLAATDGENDINLDCIVFGDPRLDLVPAKPDAK
jgi:hypothetical protein